ncbi:hypothetical protein [Nocardia sp. NBC_01388]|uniref:hypothetical protein n=1 Tax=Nocardia sp. NBC_01388 TaxID=2903596 RepID=UPI00324DC5C6
MTTVGVCVVFLLIGCAAGGLLANFTRPWMWSMLRADSRRHEQLMAAEDWRGAWSHASAVVFTLTREAHHGSRRRRARIRAELTNWSTVEAELGPRAFSQAARRTTH